MRLRDQYGRLMMKKNSLYRKGLKLKMDNQINLLTLDALPCGACRIKHDDCLTILEANREFYHIFGYTKEEAETAGFASWGFISYPPDWHRAAGMPALERDENGAFELETRCIYCGGRIIWVLVRGLPLASDPNCFNCTVLDITARRNQLEELRQSDEERKLLLEQSGSYVFRFNVKNSVLDLPAETARAFKLPERIDNAPDSLIEDGYILPESQQDFKAFYDAIRRGEKSGEMVFHATDREGSSAWCRSVFSLVIGRSGKPKYAVVSLEDISEQREKQLAYEKWTQYNKTQLKNAHIYYECNITKNRIDEIGGPLSKDIPEEVRGCYDDTFRYILKNLVYPEDLVSYRDFFSRAGMRECYKEGKRELSLEYRRFGSDGKLFWAKAEVQLLPDPYSEDIKAFFILKNIDSAKRRELELRTLSQSDALTGLLNRRAVIEQITQLLLTSSASSRHVFIMVDIDKFKMLNDTKGHQFGDRMIAELAQTLKASLREEDIVGRIGGDEFVICLRNMPLNNALEDRIASLCSLLSKRIDEQTYISSSLGVAVFPKDGITFDALYQKADIALYEAKRLGRNRFVFYQNDMVLEDWKPFHATPIDSGGEEKEEHDKTGTGWGLSLCDTGEEPNEPAAIRQYIKSLNRVFKELVVLNVTKNQFYIVFAGDNIPGLRKDSSMPEILKDAAQNCVHPEDTLRFLDFFNMQSVRTAFADGERSLCGEFRLLGENGYYWAETTLVPVEAEDEDIYLCLVRDITAKKSQLDEQTQRRVLLGRQMEGECYRTIMEQSGTIILEYAKDTNTYYASAPARQFTFVQNTGEKGNHYFLTQNDVHPADWPKTKAVSNSIHEGRSVAGATVRLKKTDGKYIWCNLALTVLRDEQGGIVRSLITVTDVDKATKDRKELEYRAEYDDLTGHYNFSKFKKDATALLHAKNGRKYSLWYCDLRNFKLINDMYGYDFGDKVLRYWANLGSSTLREGEVFARISGDNFASLHYYDDRNELEENFEKIAYQLTEFGKKQGKKLRLEMVAGIYCIEKKEDLLSIEDMIDRANIAQKSVKRADGNRVAFYTDEMRRQLLREKEIEAVMVKSLEDGEFKPYFQPMADIQNGCKICGAEALARWERPGYGVISPGEFVPLFEKNGFIVELDRHIFTQVCAYLSHRISQGYEPFKISVNVSRISVFRKDFVRRYTEIKERYAIPDGFLELECTETTMVENAELLETVMRKMRISGFRFSMDDFGSGYSSLNLLKDVTVDVLKLDMMFFRNNKLFEPRNQTIISSIVGMAKALNMKIVAEGVETGEQMQVLRRLGCDFIQGYFISRPVPITQFEKRFYQTAGL